MDFEVNIKPPGCPGHLHEWSPPHPVFVPPEFHIGWQYRGLSPNSIHRADEYERSVRYDCRTMQSEMMRLQSQIRLHLSTPHPYTFLHILFHPLTQQGADGIF